MKETNPRVSLTLGYTMNLGNFQSLRVDIGFEDSVRSDETVDQAYERVEEWTSRKLLEKLKDERQALETEGLA